MLTNGGKLIFFITLFTLLFLFQILTVSGGEPQGAEMKLAVGMPAPDFTLQDQGGAEYTLSQFRSIKNVVLYFYPMDDTPGCTKEACSFRDDFAVFDSLNTMILGVSVDGVSSHKKFAEKFSLNFPILSDADKSVSRKYDALSFYGRSKRYTYIIDREGIIRKIYTDVDVQKHPREVASFIKDNLG